jgi:peptidyl-prolyl cis-trans isomerase SurA
MKIKYTALLIVFTALQISLHAQQSSSIDQLVGVVGSKMFKQSDIENEILRQRAQGHSVGADYRCEVYEGLLGKKLLLNQAMLDSIKVSSNQIEAKLNENLNMFIAQLGSVEKLEQQYKKTLTEIKEDLRDMFRDEQLVQSMQRDLIGDVKVTPTEISDYYTKINKDSLPNINTQIEYAQLAIYPAYSDQSILDVKDQLLDIRKKILSGKPFEGLAKLYSEDESSRIHGGETDFLSKAQLDPEYAKAAFALTKPGEVSRIVETQFGYHLIQLIEKRGDRINTRHILLKAKPDPNAIARAVSALDSIADFIRKDSISFDRAVMYYSMDKDTRFNKGMLVNPGTGSTKFEFDQQQMVPADYDALKKLKKGEVSQSFESRDRTNRTFYKIVMIKSLTPAHKANLEEDFNLIQEMAKNYKRMAIIEKWFAEKKQDTYIRIDDSFKNCAFKTSGWVKEGL